MTYNLFLISYKNLQKKSPVPNNYSIILRLKIITNILISIYENCRFERIKTIPLFMEILRSLKKENKKHVK